MSRKNVPGSELIAAFEQEMPVLASEVGQKYLEALNKHVKEVLGDSLAQNHVARIRAAQKYAETELTAEDLTKIDMLETENEEKAAEIKQIKDKALSNRQKDLAKALEASDFAQVSVITAEVAKKGDELSTEQREHITSNKKLINTYNNKKNDAGINTYRTEMQIRDEKDSGSGSGSKFAFEGCRFLVESVRKQADYSADWQVEVDTRRIFVKCLGSGWAPEFKGETYHFAGFWVDLDGKLSISTRSKLGKYQNEWFRVAQQVKPRSIEDLYEVTRRTNLRAEKGNMDGKYSMGANKVYRLVEKIQAEAEDVEHQRIAANYIDPGWDKLEEQKAMVEALIDADTAKTDESSDENAQNEAETAKTDEKPAAKSKKAA